VPARILALALILLSACGRVDVLAGPPSAGAGLLQLPMTAGEVSKSGPHATDGDGVESGPSHLTCDPGSPLTRFPLLLLVIAVFVGTAIGLRRLV
jgi:hypothetical protein